MGKLATRVGGLWIAVWLALTTAAAAHPHVFVDATAEVLFDNDGRIAAVKNAWQFDEAFSAYAVEGLDANGDGKLSTDELKPLAEVNIKSLKEFDFFTYLLAADSQTKFLPVTSYSLHYGDDRLMLTFTLPLAEPLRVSRRTTLEVFDPQYFVAFSFDKAHPIRLTNAPHGCDAVFQPPHDLDAQTMAMLAAIPVDQHDLPANLAQAASVLANRFIISCK